MMKLGSHPAGFARVSMLAALAALSMALLAACGSDEAEPAAPTTDSATPAAAESVASTVNATLTEWAIEVDPASVPAGDVTFVVANAGVIPHELVVIRTDLAHDALEVVDGVVQEDQYEVIGEVEEFAGGATESGTFTLEAGDYVLICDIPAHYQQGMHLPFTVE